MRTAIECSARSIVLRRAMDDAEAQAAVDARKAAPFRTLISSPKRSEIHTHSVRVAYEATTMLSGTYSASYYRKATHTIRVDHNVKRVEIGDGVFDARSPSRIGRAISGKRASRNVNLELEEFVVDKCEGTVFIDHHGHATKFKHSTKPDALEPYPKRILKSAGLVRDPEVTQDALIARLREEIAPGPEPADVRGLEDKLTLKRMVRIYAPIVEARLVGPKKRIRILRIDAISRRTLKA